MATLLPRANLNEQVYETLRRRILAREHGPGEKLSLHELASELGVSRSPVHHALTRLVEAQLLARPVLTCQDPPSEGLVDLLVEVGAGQQGGHGSDVT